MSFLSEIREIRKRSVARWLIPYLLQVGRRLRRPRGPIHVLICIADHFEPRIGKSSREVARARVEKWVRDYPENSGVTTTATGGRPVTPSSIRSRNTTRAPRCLAGLCRRGLRRSRAPTAPRQRYRPRTSGRRYWRPATASDPVMACSPATGERASRPSDSSMETGRWIIHGPTADGAG